MAWDEKDRKACCEIVKDCLAMANTEGGYLVIGVRETSSVPSIDGLSREQADSWETTRLNNFINNYADPPINTTMKNTLINGRFVAVIAIPRFTEVPHVCKRDYPNVLSAPTFYVRTDANASEPLRTSADAHALIEHAVRQRADQLLSSIHLVLKSGLATKSVDAEEQYKDQIEGAKIRLHELSSNKYVNSPLIYSAIYPSDFDSERLDLENLSAVARKSYVDYFGWAFPFIDTYPYDTSRVLNDCIETYYDRPDYTSNSSASAYYNSRVDYWRLYRSGLLFHTWNPTIEYNQTGQPSTSVSMLWLARTPAFAAKCLVNLLGQYADDVASASLDVEVANLSGTGLLQDMLKIPLGGTYICQSSAISERRTLSLAEWRAAYTDIAADIAWNMLLKFQYSHLTKRGITRDFEAVFSRKLT